MNIWFWLSYFFRSFIIAIIFFGVLQVWFKCAIYLLGIKFNINNWFFFSILGFRKWFFIRIDRIFMYNCINFTILISLKMSRINFRYKSTLFYKFFISLLSDLFYFLKFIHHIHIILFINIWYLLIHWSN